MSAVTLMNSSDKEKLQSAPLQSSLYDLLNSFVHLYQLNSEVVTPVEQVGNELLGRSEVISLINKTTGILAARITVHHNPDELIAGFSEFTSLIRNLALTPRNVQTRFSWISNFEENKNFLDEHSMSCKSRQEVELVVKAYPFMLLYMYLAAGSVALKSKSEIIYIYLSLKMTRVFSSLRFQPITLGSEFLDHNKISRHPVAIKANCFLDEKNPLNVILNAIQINVKPSS